MRIQPRIPNQHKPHLAFEHGKWTVYWMGWHTFRDACWMRFKTNSYHSYGAAWLAYLSYAGNSK